MRMITILLIIVFFLSGGALLLTTGCQAMKGFVSDHKTEIISLITDVVQRILTRITVSREDGEATTTEQIFRESVIEQVRIEIDNVDLNDPEIRAIISRLIDAHFESR